MLAKLMEPAATKVAVELQLADINDQLDGLYDEPEITDHDRARLQLLRADLHQQLQILEQHLHTLNVMRGEHEDRVAIVKCLEEEQQAISDHRFAMHLAGLTVTDTATRTLSDHEASIIANLKDNYDEQWESTKKAHAAALEQEMANRVPPDCPLVSQCREAEVDQKSTTLESKTMIKCCACMEAFGNEDALTLDCKPEAHSYCRDCLIDMFANAMVDPTLFPPRCCKLPFPLETCRAMLPQELVKDFDLKVEELATPNPTFCANAECSKFIRPKEITADIASCLFCQEKTCTRCKSSEHAGLCPTDPHVQLLMDLAKRSKWQQCTKCKNMVQLEEGCFHMTCRCKHEFCYLCGVQWKTCLCPQWDEHYLTRAARGAPAARVLRRARQDPRRCLPDSHHWRRVNGEKCESCGADYLAFVMRCCSDGCRVTHCWRCIDTLNLN